MDRGNRAFTLIELLLVVAVIIILVAILFPILKSAKHQANDSSVVNNLHQLGLAFQLYLNDSDDVFPSAYEGPAGVGQTGGWIFYSDFQRFKSGTFDPNEGSVYPYIKIPDFYADPLDPQGRTSRNSFSMSSFIAPFTGTGYNMGRASNTVRDLSDTMLLGEEATGLLGPDNPTYDQGSDDGYFNYPGDHFAKWRPEGTLIITADAHAKIVDAQGQYNQTICGQVEECDDNGKGTP